MFHASSGTTWKEYLAKNLEQTREGLQELRTIVHADLEKQIDSISKYNRGVETLISAQARDIVASGDSLRNAFGEHLDDINLTLDWWFDRLASGLGSIQYDIQSLGANFDYKICLVLEELQMQNQALKDIVERVDRIYNAVVTPMRTRARELFQEACTLLGKGLVDKALDFFHRAEGIYDADFFTEFEIGKLYLYGKDAEIDVVNLVNAEKHLRMACRYGKAEIPQLPEMHRYVGEALFQLSIACYVQAVEDKMLGNQGGFAKHLMESASAAKESFSIHPNLSESHYHFAKCSALLGKADEAVTSLEKAISADRNYCIKADRDADFNGIRQNVLSLFAQLRQEAGLKGEGRLVVISEELQRRDFKGSDEHRLKDEIESSIEAARQVIGRGTYFDYLDAIKTLDQANDLIDKQKECEALRRQRKDEADEALRKADSMVRLLADWYPALESTEDSAYGHSVLFKHKIDAPDPGEELSRARELYVHQTLEALTEVKQRAESVQRLIEELVRNRVELLNKGVGEKIAEAKGFRERLAPLIVPDISAKFSDANELLAKARGLSDTSFFQDLNILDYIFIFKTTESAINKFQNVETALVGKLSAFRKTLLDSDRRIGDLESNLRKVDEERRKGFLWANIPEGLGALLYVLYLLPAVRIIVGVVPHSLGTSIGGALLALALFIIALIFALILPFVVFLIWEHVVSTELDARTRTLQAELDKLHREREVACTEIQKYERCLGEQRLFLNKR